MRQGKGEDEEEKRKGEKGVDVQDGSPV